MDGVVTAVLVLELLQLKLKAFDVLLCAGTDSSLCFPVVGSLASKL